MQQKCPACNGSGEYTYSVNGWGYPEKCSECNGSRRVQVSPDDNDYAQVAHVARKMFECSLRQHGLRVNEIERNGLYAQEEQQWHGRAKAALYAMIDSTNIEELRRTYPEPLPQAQEVNPLVAAHLRIYPKDKGFLGESLGWDLTP